jgi:uncharacterized protein (UPF0261 family)
MLTIAVVGTFDTKGIEHNYVADFIRQRGHRALLIDVGSTPPSIAHDVTSEQVRLEAYQHSGNSDLLRPLPNDRGLAIDTMSAAAATYVRAMLDRQEIHGMISLGGTGGTSIGTRIMRNLPIGFPKVMVSTVASGDVSKYIDVSDIVMIPSIVDVSGLNRISTSVFARAAACVVGMAEANSVQSFSRRESKPVIVASMFGNTTKCVEHARTRLERLGYEVIVFHATGTGGRTMESLIESGMVAGVLDITTTEWADELIGGVMAAGPTRLEAAARRGVPAVIAPGCLDMVNFRETGTIPPQFQSRLFYQHNPQITLMRTTADECKQLGEILASKINQSVGDVHVLFPLRAISMISAPGGIFHDPQADEALRVTLKGSLRQDIPYEEIDCEINDVRFSERCVECLLAGIEKSQVQA